MSRDRGEVIRDGKVKRRRLLEPAYLAAKKILEDSPAWELARLKGLERLRVALELGPPDPNRAMYTLGRCREILEQLYEPEAIVREYDELRSQLSSSPETT